jgi:glycine cleavage system aminomethyltransferase T
MKIDKQDNKIWFCDVSGIGKLRISGQAAHDFIRIMFTAAADAFDELGAAASCLLLTGEAEVIDVVLVVRSGDSEYMVTTSAEIVEEASAWLAAHSLIRDDDGEVFADLKIGNETDRLACVALFGEGSWAVLDELAVGGLDSCPQPGCLTMAQLDTVPVLILHSPVLPGECYELMFPPAKLPGIVNALMSFAEVEPMSAEDYQVLRRRHRRWFEQAEDAAYCYPDESGLMRLVRPELDFVGGPALKQRLAGGS